MLSLRPKRFSSSGLAEFLTIGYDYALSLPPEHPRWYYRADNTEIMVLSNHMLYQITVKALLFRDGKLLVLTSPDGYLDFPGGRVDASEQHLTWEESLAREIREELGEAVRIRVGETAFVTKRAYTLSGTSHYVAAIYFNAEYTDGEIALSDEHSHAEWVDPGMLATADYKFVSEDERRQMQAYFSR